MALPELVAEHDDRLWILAVDGVRGLQAASQRRWHAEEIEGVGADVDRLHVFREIAAGDGQVPLVLQKGIFDDRRLADAAATATRSSRIPQVALGRR